MKAITITIADIPLRIEYKHKSPPYSFSRFKTQTAKLTSSKWLLVSSDIKAKSIRRSSFYFDDPVEINTKKRIIKHFYRYKEGNDFDSRLVSFAYAQILALNNGVLLHCAAVKKGSDGYLFFAHSGGGKSTIAQLSKKYQVFGDDIIALRKIKNKFLAYSTPWRQRRFIKAAPSLSAEVKGVFFLKKANKFNLRALKAEEALVKVLTQQVHFFLYTPRPLVKKIFFTAADFFKTVPAYEMSFRKNNNFWPDLEKALKRCPKLL